MAEHPPVVERRGYEERDVVPVSLPSTVSADSGLRHGAGGVVELPAVGVRGENRNRDSSTTTPPVMVSMPRLRTSSASRCSECPPCEARLGSPPPTRYRSPWSGPSRRAAPHHRRGQAPIGAEDVERRHGGEDLLHGRRAEPPVRQPGGNLPVAFDPDRHRHLAAVHPRARQVAGDDIGEGGRDSLGRPGGGVGMGGTGRALGETLSVDRGVARCRRQEPGEKRHGEDGEPAPCLHLGKLPPFLGIGVLVGSPSRPRRRRRVPQAGFDAGAPGMGAPGRIRTCAPGSGGRCSIP